MHAEEIKRAQDLEAKKRRKAERKARKAAAVAIEAVASDKPDHAEDAKKQLLSDKPDSAKEVEKQVKPSPVAFVFPGQGSQAVGMLQVCSIPSCFSCLRVWANERHHAKT